MKKLSLFLLMAFLASFPLNFISATQYCGETITATNNKTAILTCTNPSTNTYVMEITSTEPNFYGLMGDNMYCHINGTVGYHMTDNYTFKDGKVTFTITSTTVPKMYTPLYLNINNAECEFKTIQNQTFEWPASCSGGGGTTASNYCQKEIKSSDNEATIQLTCTKESEGNYQIVIEGENLKGLGGSFYNPGNKDLRTAITSSTSTKIVLDFELDNPPTIYTPLYVLIPGEKSFTWPTDITWGQCSSGGDPVAVTGVTLNKSTLSLDAGANETLVATIAPENATNKNVSWESDNKAVATVDTKGKVTGVAEGTANITVTTKDGSKTDVCTVTVTTPEPPVVKVCEGSGKTSIEDKEFTDGYKYKFKATKSGSNVSVAVEFTLLDSRDGVVAYLHNHTTGANPFEQGMSYNGTTKVASITLTNQTWEAELKLACKFAFAGGMSKTEIITYNVGDECSASVPVESVAITSAPAAMDVNASVTLGATITPATATNQNVTWEIVSGNDYATIDATTGELTATAAGEVKVKVTTEDGAKTDDATITINAVVAKTYHVYTSKDGIYMLYSITRNADRTLSFIAQLDHNKSGLNAQINLGEYQNMTLTDGKYQYKTTAQYNSGTAVNGFFYFAYVGGASQFDFSYTVGEENEVPVVNIESLEVSPTSISFAKNDPDAQLTATKHPTFATGDITWTTDDDAIAIVTNGLVHPVADGETTITATCGSKSATCDVTVELTELEPATYNVAGRDNTNDIDVILSITRNVNRTLTYVVKATHEKEGFTVQVNDGDFRSTAFADDKYTYTTVGTYADGTVINGYVYMPYAGGAGTVPFSYTVGSESILIDEADDNAATITANDGKTVNVAMARQFIADGGNYTLCLPFSMDADQCLAAFGEGYKLYEMGEPYIKSESVIFLPFNAVSSIEAGKPYLFCPAANVNYPVISGVEIVDEDPAMVGNDIAKMIGMYSPEEVAATDYVLGDENWLYKSDGTDMRGLRCYFSLGSAAPVAARARAIFNQQDVVTNLDNVNENENENGKMLINDRLIIIRDGRSYNAQGQIVK